MISKNFTSFRILFGRIVKMLPFPHNLGAGADKVWGFEEVFPEFPQTARKVFVLLFSLKRKIITTFYRDDLQRKGLNVILQALGTIFYKSNKVGRYFCPNFQGFCPDFHEFYPDFQGFCPAFQQIKTFGGALAPSTPRVLHHCLTMTESSDIRRHHAFFRSLSCASLTSVIAASRSASRFMLFSDMS